MGTSASSGAGGSLDEPARGPYPFIGRGALVASSFLTEAELAELDRLYLAAVSTIEELRAETPGLGKHLCLPRLPTALSEGIGAAVVPRLFGGGAIAFRPGQRNDLGVRYWGKGSAQIIAVKGTGSARWITVTPTDLQADRLLWIDYSRRLRKGAATVDLYLFGASRAATWGSCGRRTFAQLVSEYGKTPSSLRFNVHQLAKLS